MKKQIETVSAEIMNALVNWTWPGNVRELSPQDSFNEGTLESLRRETIVRVLRETGGVLSGPGGAAARLGLKRTTLRCQNAEAGNFPRRV
jgi:formate hydrogenlyase transcriptional activator